MGIINSTPDSFSDGGECHRFETFKKKVEFWQKSGAQIIDIGAQSTAPQSVPISLDEELTRLDQTLFPYIHEHSWPKDLILSLDTYRWETFYHFHDLLKKRAPNTQVLWNDVSGCWDELTMLRFRELGVGEQYRYVYTWTFVPRRELTPLHHEFLTPERGEAFLRLLDKRVREIFSMGLTKRVIIDPGFGFSKTAEQNRDLIQGLPQLISNFPQDQWWLLGISRKSFLRKLTGTIEMMGGLESLEHSERIHTYLLSKWTQEIFPKNPHLIYRIHDPSVAKISQFLTQIFPFSL